MLEPPRTRDEAEKYRYHQWAGNPAGTRYSKDSCAYEVYVNWGGRQCHLNKGYGPDGLYCKLHAKIVEKVRND